jgi:hypothetical protein
MVNAMTSEETKIVPLFKSFDELQADESAIAVDVECEWNEANQAYDAAMSNVAALKRNPPGDICATYTKTTAALNKFASLDPANAATCYRMIQDLAALEKRRIGLEGDMAIERAEIDAARKLMDARKAVVDRRDERMFGFGKLARRSQRFATAQMNRPGATR